MKLNNSTSSLEGWAQAAVARGMELEQEDKINTKKME